MEMQLENIRIQIKNLDNQYETLIYQLQNNNAPNAGYQLYNLSLQILNIAIQMLNSGNQFPMFGNDITLIKNQNQTLLKKDIKTGL